MNWKDNKYWCSECHKEMVLTNTYTQFCPEIQEEISVPSHRPFLMCPDGCEMHVPGEVCIDGYRLQIQRRIEEWILQHIHSFEELSKYCYTKKQTLAYISRQSKKIHCDDERFNPKVINNVLDWYCFHVRICGEHFYLKKSVKKYCRNFCGWFPLTEDIKD